MPPAERAAPVGGRGMTRRRRPRSCSGLVGDGIGGSLTPAMQEREGRERGPAVSYRLDRRRACSGSARTTCPSCSTGPSGSGSTGSTSPIRSSRRSCRSSTSSPRTPPTSARSTPSSSATGSGSVATPTGRGSAARSARSLPGRGRRPGRARRRRAAPGSPSATGCSTSGADARRRSHDARRRARRRVRRAPGQAVRRRPGRAGRRPRRAPCRGARGLVNATPVGMTRPPRQCRCRPSCVAPDLWVADVVYFPLETELVRLARSRGCRVMAGGGMAVQQAVGRLRALHRPPADADRMAPALRGADRLMRTGGIATRLGERPAGRQARPPSRQRASTGSRSSTTTSSRRRCRRARSPSAAPTSA